MSRWSPKDWPARKARRSHEARAWDASPLRHKDRLSLVLRDIWADRRARPAWAKLARSRGWLTESGYYAVEADVRVPSIGDLVYRDSPLLKMIRKDKAF